MVGKSLHNAMVLAAHIHCNLGKPFTIATPAGIYSYTVKFTSHEEITESLKKQEKVREHHFWYDEAQDIPTDAISFLARKGE